MPSQVDTRARRVYFCLAQGVHIVFFMFEAMSKTINAILRKFCILFCPCFINVDYDGIMICLCKMSIK